MKETIMGTIYSKALEIIEEKPEGIRWVDLLNKIGRAYPDFHPKTINGCVWRLTEKYPDKIYKSEKGRFRHIKYKEK